MTTHCGRPPRSSGTLHARLPPSTSLSPVPPALALLPLAVASLLSLSPAMGSMGRTAGGRALSLMSLLCETSPSTLEWPPLQVYTRGNGLGCGR
jgi:hypothetical protein